MSRGEFIDAIQTAVLVITAFSQIYILVLLRNEIRGAAGALRRVIDELADARARLDRIEDRLDR